MNLRALAPVHVSEHSHMSETSHYMRLYIGVRTPPTCIYHYVHASGCKMLAASLLQLDKKIIKFSKICIKLRACVWVQDAGCKPAPTSLLQDAGCKPDATQAALLSRVPKFRRLLIHRPIHYLTTFPPVEDPIGSFIEGWSDHPSLRPWPGQYPS